MALLIPEARLGPPPEPLPQPTVRERVRLRLASAEDREDLVGFVRELSPESTHHRFLTGLGGRVPGALLERLLTGGPGGGALVAHLDQVLVGHALWARAHPAAPVAEIAMVVADACQRQGVGSLLLEAMQVEMASAGVERVQVVTAGANRPVLRMIGSRRPGAKPTERDGPALTYEFSVRHLAAHAPTPDVSG